MKQISRDRAVRCVAVIFANNEQGKSTASQLISNMFDLDRQTSYEQVKEAMYAKEEHKRLGGRLKDFEDGKILEEKT